MSFHDVQIGDLGRIVTGKTPPTNDSENYNGFIPFVTPADLNGNRSLFQTERYISDKGKETVKNCLLPKNSVCVSCIGSDMGKTAITTCPSVTNQQINSIIVHDHYNYLYVYYLMCTLEQTIKSLGKNGTAIPILNKSKFSSIIIRVPDYSTQSHIANILSAYDDLIENNQKQIKLLEEAAQRLYKEWFIDLRFPGYETTPVHDGVPEGWEITTTENAAAILRRGISPSYDENGDSTVINQKCIRQTIVDLDEARKQTKKYPDDLNLQDGDTVICSTGDGTLGRVGQIFGKLENTTLDSHVTLVRATSEIGAQLLFWTVKSQQAFLQGMGKGSTNQLELSRSVIQELPFILPDPKTKKAFEVLTQAIHDKITEQNKQIIALQTARDRLLPKLMSGEMEV